MNGASAEAFFLRLRGQALRTRQRRVVVVHGDAPWRERLLKDLPARLGLSQAVWLGAPMAGWPVYGGGPGGLIGRECDLAGFEFFVPADADRFGALSGSLRAGGLLFLPLGEDAGIGHFAARWRHLLAQAEEVLWLEADAPWPALAEVPRVAAPRADALGCLTQDQRQAVEAVCRVATGHRRRPLVLTADRGRGKSAAFGLAAAALIRQRASRIVVTGPNLAATGAVFAAAESRLPQAQRSRGWLRLGAGELRFIAPDALAAGSEATDLLLVDEAAALPVDLLRRLLMRHARIAFATTVHGYEGSGQAFRLRFGAELNRRTPGWRALSMREPVRWADGDPLERLTSRLLWQDAEPPAVGVRSPLPAACRCERLAPQALAADETAARNVFGLLRLAHYRSRPRDWVQWLDAETMALWALRCEGELAAVAVTAQEGGLEPALAEAVGSGARRLRGELLPQVLVAHAGLVEAASLRGLRIVRLAVHPALQRRGLGKRLLDCVQASAAGEGLDWVGASFGAQGGLLRFWRAAGYAPVRLGFTREAISGARAALVMRGLSPAVSALAARAAARFAEGLPGWLCDPLADLEAGVALECLAAAGAGPVAAAALQEAARFVAAAATYEDAQPWLRALCVARLGALWAQGALAPTQAKALLYKLVQGRAWAEVAAALDVPGRAPLLEILRAGVAALLQPPAPDSDLGRGNGHDA